MLFLGASRGILGEWLAFELVDQVKQMALSGVGGRYPICSGLDWNKKGIGKLNSLRAQWFVLVIPIFGSSMRMDGRLLDGQPDWAASVGSGGRLCLNKVEHDWGMYLLLPSGFHVHVYTSVPASLTNTHNPPLKIQVKKPIYIKNCCKNLCTGFCVDIHFNFPRPRNFSICLFF